MPGKHRLSPEYPSSSSTEYLSTEYLTEYPDPEFLDEQAGPSGRHRGSDPEPDQDQHDDSYEVTPESTSSNGRQSSVWSLPTIPISIPSPRRPQQPAWTAAAWCADMPQQSKVRGRHRAPGGSRKASSSTGSHELAPTAPMFPKTDTPRPSLPSSFLHEQAESSTPGTVRSVAILAAVATGAVVVAAQDEADAAGTSVEPTGGEHREVRFEPQSAPIPLPEVLTLSREGADERAVQALDAAVARDVRTFKGVGTPYQAEAQGDQVDRWIAEALGLMGLPMSLAPGVRNIVMKESNGDPNAINLWDSNARKGIPSQGLMQTIPATYRACVLPSLADRPITDPVANITAGVRAMIANHGVATLAEGGRRNSSGRYIGYGGGKVPGSNFISQVTGQLQALPGLL